MTFSALDIWLRALWDIMPSTIVNVNREKFTLGPKKQNQNQKVTQNK